MSHGKAVIPAAESASAFPSVRQVPNTCLNNDVKCEYRPLLIRILFFFFFFITLKSSSSSSLLLPSLELRETKSLCALEGGDASRRERFSLSPRAKSLQHLHRETSRKGGGVSYGISYRRPRAIPEGCMTNILFGPMFLENCPRPTVGNPVVKLPPFPGTYLFT